MSCSEFEPMIADRLFGEPDAASREALDRHLARCEDCRRTLAGMQAALGVASMRTRPEPDAATWASFDARLGERLRDERVPQRTRVLWLRARPWAAAVAFLGLGLVLGRTVLAPVPAAPDAPSAVQTVAGDVLERTTAYLDRSRLLLLDIAHSEGETDDPAALDLPRRSRIARELVTEAADLGEALSAADERRLRALVADLETILAQLAALETGLDLPGLELVRSEVESRALLFRIDIERLRAAEPRQTRSRTRNDA